MIFSFRTTSLLLVLCVVYAQTGNIARARKIDTEHPSGLSLEAFAKLFQKFFAAPNPASIPQKLARVDNFLGAEHRAHFSERFARHHAGAHLGDRRQR